MKVLVTGSLGGIGKAVVNLFISKGHLVTGIDIKDIDKKNIKSSNKTFLSPSYLSPSYLSPSYTHICADISKPSKLPQIDDVEILISCAGVQNSTDDIDVNLKGTINVVEKYAFQKTIKSVLIVCSASAHTGAEFTYYSASKGGLLSYTRNAAIRLARYGATCNSISPGGVKTDLNLPVMKNEKLWKQIMDLTPLKKWAESEEIANWCYFLTVENKSCTGEDILIDNGETHLNSKFIWPEPVN